MKSESASTEKSNEPLVQILLIAARFIQVGTSRIGPISLLVVIQTMNRFLLFVKIVESNLLITYLFTYCSIIICI